MTDTNSVISEKRGQAFWITINRPDKRNAINADVVAGIARGYRDAHDDKEVRVIVLTGAGDKAFCAGADLKGTSDRGTTLQARESFGGLSRILEAMARMRTPVIAQVDRKSTRLNSSHRALSRMPSSA